MDNSVNLHITRSVLKAFALGYYYGRTVGIEDNPYSVTTYADEYKAFADGYHEGHGDFCADA